MIEPRRLALQEFRTEHAVLLSVEQRDALRRLHPGLRMDPSSNFDDRYDLTPDQRIGLICVPGLIIEIRPKVPMSSVLFLVSHACHAVGWFDQQPDFGRDADLHDIIALMLARMVGQATRRGLVCGYRTEDEALQAPRGRILFDEQLRRRLGHSPPIEVRHDDFTSDVMENRLLVAALDTVSRLPLRSPASRRELHRAQRLFGGVERVHFPRWSVPDVMFTRLNRHYKPALSLATLILRSASLDLGVGGGRGSALLVDMNVVFEQFVRTALREALKQPVPDKAPPLCLDEAGAVPLKPDLCVIMEGRIAWVGDAKYKRLPSGGYRNADLYQMLAYAIAMGLPGGTLIYAADEGVNAAEHTVLEAGKRLRVVALDLFAPPAAIRRQVEAIANAIRATLEQPMARGAANGATLVPVPLDGMATLAAA